MLSALMLHHLDRDTKAAAAAEVARVLWPGGRLHLVDFTGENHGIHGALSRHVAKSAHVADNLDHGIPTSLDAADLACTEATTAYRHPVFGQISYYRAVRPS